jgi:hypothetical protein
MTQGEGTVITGAGSQTTENRWGDYSSLTVDPSNGCTFWYVNEYQPANGAYNWRTRIATFSLPGCNPPPPPPPSPQPQPPPSSSPPPATTTTTTSAAAQPAIPLPPGAQPAAALDTTPPAVTIAGASVQKLKNALKRGVLVDLGCSERCNLSVSLLLGFKTAHALHLAARQPVKVGAKTLALPGAGHRRTRVRFSSRAKQQLRSVRAVKLKVRVLGRDRAGNVTTRTKTLSLR